MRSVGIASIELTEAEIEAAVEVLRDGGLRQGPRCEAFEQAFARWCGCEHAVACANGSAALHLAYLCTIRPGDEVLVPAFTFIATASMVMAAGGRPVLCDVDPESGLLDLEDARGRLTERTRAIAPVHLFGNVCDLDAVREFAAEHSLAVIWDAAQAHGATWRGVGVGSCPDFATFSFYPSKNMFVGEGGMVCTNDGEQAERLRLMRSHGQSGKYYHTLFGLNYRMTDVEAAIGLAQLSRVDKMLAARRRNAQRLNAGLSEVPGVTPLAVDARVGHAWHQYCVVVDPHVAGIDRNQMRARLADVGIATGVHYPRGLNRQPVFEAEYGEQPRRATDLLAERIVALPVHHGLLEEDVEYVIEQVVNIVA